MISTYRFRRLDRAAVRGIIAAAALGRSRPATPTRKAIEDLAAELAVQLQGHICVLPELTSATRRDVEDLIADVQDELRRHVSNADYQEWFGGKPSLPMDIAINRLDEVLESQPRN